MNFLSETFSLNRRMTLVDLLRVCIAFVLALPNES